MEKTITKKNFVFWALIASIVCITIISIMPVMKNSSDQRALALASNKAAETKVVSGRYMIGVTISEDFLKEGSEKVIQEIFIDGKKYEFTSDNISTEIKSGFYDVRGTLNTKTSKVVLTSAKFAGEIFDGLKDDATTKTLNPTLKKKKLAVFLVDYQDTATQPFYPATINEMMFGTGKFKSYFKEASYDRLPISGDVFGWHTIPQNAGNGACWTNLEADLAPLIAGSPVDLNNYGNIVIITLCNGFVANGQSNTGPQPYNINGTIYNKTVTWVNISANTWNQLSNQMVESMAGPHVLTNLERLLTHEFGHALGLHHANAISCEGTLPNADCQGVGLGNYYDTMAYETIGLHLNVWSKAKLGWFNSNELKTITQSGVYTINSLESQPPVLQLAQAVKAYKIKPSVNSPKTPIWIEFRNGFGFDAGLNTPALGGIQSGGGEVPPYNIAENKNGIMVYKESFDNTYSGLLNAPAAKLMYLRGAPNLSNENPYQVSLNPGQTYTEPRYGLTVTTLPSTSPTQRKFQVTMSPNLACTHLPPTVKSWQMIPSPLPVGSNTTISNFMANMDYISCPNSNFTYSFDFGGLQQNGGTSNLLSFLSNLAPDDERQFLFSVSAPNGTAPGTYNISATITNQTSGLSTASTTSITVQ